MYKRIYYSYKCMRIIVIIIFFQSILRYIDENRRAQTADDYDGIILIESIVLRKTAVEKYANFFYLTYFLLKRVHELCVFNVVE